MKKITGKLLAALIVSLFFFASCSNGSNSKIFSVKCVKKSN